MSWILLMDQLATIMECIRNYDYDFVSIYKAYYKWQQQYECMTKYTET